MIYDSMNGHGSHLNIMKPMKPIHASGDAVFVQSGNTLCQMNTYSSETRDLMKNHPEFFKDMLDHMSEQVKELKKEFKEIENGKR